jgi:hypothetical protein
MSVPVALAKLAGSWTGSNRLHVPWMPEPVKDSESTASVSLITQGKALCIRYTWIYDGQPQDGIMLLSSEGEGSGGIVMIYTDSWHLGNVFMRCEGTVDDRGTVNVKGYYTVPEHPDWGWQTGIFPGENEFRFVVYNVSPEGEETLAVEAEFTRA